MTGGQHEDSSFTAPEPASGNAFTKAWAIGTADRALKSFAASLLLLLGGGTVGLNLLQVDWLQALGTAAGTTVISVLFSVASAPVGEPGTTSLLPGGR
jgi:hypothetical protein